MARLTGRLKRLEQRRRATMPTRIEMVFSDMAGNVTTAAGQTLTAAEWARLHPDAIQLTWGDDAPDNRS